MTKEVTRLLGRMPKYITIGPHKWQLVVSSDIRPEKEGDKVPWGETASDTMTIKLHPEHPTTQIAVGTLWHEVYHAALISLGVPQPRKEEAGALLFETIVSSVVQANPWLLDWTKRGLK